MGKINNVHRDPKLKKKFNLVIEAIRKNIANRTQYNREADFSCGLVYAIKVEEHRFYTLEQKSDGYREYFISKYGRKQSEQNTKKLTDTINTIENITIEKITEWIT